MDSETFLGIVLPGLATGLGGLGLFLVRRTTEAALDTLLGFTAG